MSKTSPTSFFSTAGRALLAMTFVTCIAAPVIAQQQDAPPPPASDQQGPGRGAEMQERQLDHMTKALNLTPDQVSQIRAIHADTRQQMVALHNDTSVAPQDKHDRMMSIHQASEMKVKALLNEDQKAKYDAMQARMREHREGRRVQGQGGDQQPPPPPQN